MTSAGIRRHITPPVVLGTAIFVAFVAYGALGNAASIPRFFLDELRYMDIGVALAQGDGFEFRGESERYGPVFPLMIAAVVWVTDTQVATYELVKVVNTALFVLAAIPWYLLSRRLLPPWLAVGVTAMCLAIPSSMYVSVVMTESIGFFVVSWALFAVLRAYERPTVARQVVALGATVIAVATRPQFVAVFAAYVIGFVLLGLLSPSHRSALRAHARLAWPTALAVAAALAWFARPLTRGDGIGDALGSYAVLARSYDVIEIARWFVYHAGDLVLYTAVIPAVVTPVVVVRLWRRGRGGDGEAAALLALLATQLLAAVGIVAAFASSEFGLGLLYDRYLFYVVPLLLLVFVTWVHDGMPRPVLPLTTGALAAVALVAVMPYETMAERSWFREFQAVATEVWGKVSTVTDVMPLLSLRMAAVLASLALVAVALFLPRRLAAVAVTCVVVGLAANLSLSWRSNFVPAATYGLSAGGSRTWVDDAVEEGRAVILTGGATCADSEVVYFALLETEMFNRTVERRVSVDRGLRDDGTVLSDEGRPVRAVYVVSGPDVELEGERIARGLDPGLGLWRTDGTVRVVTPPTAQQDC